jgi:phosphate starvation-inducible PhoH-like protein
MAHKVICITFADHHLLVQLFGDNDKNLLDIEQKLNVFTSSRGNTVSISGLETDVNYAKLILESLYHRLQQGHDIGIKDINAMVSQFHSVEGNMDDAVILDINNQFIIKTRKKNIIPYSKNQLNYINLIQQKDIVFAEGPAGTGKTYLAVAMAVSMFLNRDIERIILSRPIVEAGEKLGFLPGDIKDKIDPYLRPLYDALHDMLSSDILTKLVESGDIELAPLAFMRGRTLNNAFIILDEAQNTTPVQMKMFLTRLGESSKIVITGDLSQIDLPPNVKSGLADATTKLADISEIGFAQFSNKDIIRHPLTSKIIDAYKPKVSG